MRCTALLACLLIVGAYAGNPIPTTPDGFTYAGSAGAQVVFEIFGDTMCPDTAGAWPTMKKVAQAYTPAQLKLVFHAFSLPYTHNSFLTNLGIFVVQNQTSSAIFEYIEAIFANQNSLWNGVTKNMTTTDVIAKIADIAVTAGAAPYAAGFINGMADSTITERAITGWKYIASRGVSGTPTFFINGVAIDADPQWSVSDWQSLIDPLLAPSTAAVEEEASVVTLCHAEDEAMVMLSNSTCPSGETSCEYVPNKYMCCYPGELCIKNEGCTCFSRQNPMPVCQTNVIQQDAASSTCPSGLNSCEYVPGKYECCAPGEMCIKNEGCTCASSTPVSLCREEDEKPLVFESASTNCSVGQTACDYLPGKTMCCYPGEVCIKNEGCTCFSKAESDEDSYADSDAPAAEVQTLCHGDDDELSTSDNATCPSGETSCEYVPGKYMCCYPGELCIKNEGCTCFSQENPVCKSDDFEVGPPACASYRSLCQFGPGRYQCCNPGQACVQGQGCEIPEEQQVDATPTCPSGLNSCEYVPGKYECCAPGEMCIKNEGCTCASSTPVSLCREEDEKPLVFESASTNCSVGQTACDYLPGKTMCCYPGEVCIKNEGCTCFSQQEDDSTDSSSEEGSADDGAVDEDKDAPLNPNNSCGRTELASTFTSPPDCPSGEPLCEYLPGKYQCCLATEMCIKNVGCRC